MPQQKPSRRPPPDRLASSPRPRVPAPRTRFLRPFTTHVVNPVTRLVAGWLPGFAIVTQIGRRSGRVHRTPVNVFRRGPEYIFALTYGSDVDWVKNVLAAGGCELRVRGRTVRVGDPRVFVDPARELMPFPVRQFLGFMRVSEFMTVRPNERIVDAPAAPGS